MSTSAAAPRYAPNDAALIDGALKGNMRRVKAALEAGANANGPPALRYAPIMAATLRDDVKMIELFIDHGADPNKCADHNLPCPTLDVGIMPGERAMHVAAKRGNGDTVRLLKRAGADINATDTRGRTPLLAACGCLSGCVEVARVLLELGADPALADKMRCTPLHAVAQHGITELVDELYSKAPASLNLSSTDGRTPLFTACCEGRESMASRLLSLGATQWKLFQDPSMSPIAVAAVRGHMGVVRVLVTAGFKTAGGEATLPYALYGAVTSSNSATTLRMLLAVDGEETRSYWVNIAINGKKLLHHAAGFCRPASVSILLAAGADEAVRDREGRTPQDAIGVDLGVEGQPPMDRGKGIAVRRMLQQGPAYRARSWAWPAEEAGGGASRGERDAVVSPPAAASKVPVPVSVRIFRPKDDRKFFVGLVDRYCRKG